MALASLAFDLLFVRAILAHLGVEFDELPEATTADHEAHALVERTSGVHGPIDVETDAKSAHDLIHRNTSGGGATRHVDRKEFKMRELQQRKLVAVRLVPTEAMEADLMTKILDYGTFCKHRASLKNMAAA